MNDSKRLLKALRQVNATPIQARMAAILLAVNGLENALEFVRGLQHNEAPGEQPLGLEKEET